LVSTPLISASFSPLPRKIGQKLEGISIHREKADMRGVDTKNYFKNLFWGCYLLSLSRTAAL